MIESQKQIINIIKKAQSGDKEAFGQLYDCYFEAIFKYVYRRVNHTHTAEDLTEDVFVKCWESIESLKDPEAFTSWLYTIARNKLTDYYRQSGRELIQVSLEAAWNVQDQGPLPDTQASSLQDLAVLKKYLNLLPSSYQEILELKFFQELETLEIAKILNKRTGAVRILQMRAINRLREMLIEANEI